MMQNGQKPEAEEIQRIYSEIEQKYPHSFQSIISILFQLYGVQTDERCLKQENTHYKFTNNAEQLIVSSFSSSQKHKNQQVKPTPTRYQIQQQFIQKVKNKNLSIQDSVYQRYGGYFAPKKTKQDMNQRQYHKDVELTSVIQKAQGWKEGAYNKQFRIFASKTSPKVGSEEGKIRYFQKRLAAKAFCEWTTGLNKDQFPNSHQNRGFSTEKKQCKTVSIAFISDGYRQFQKIFSQKMKFLIRQLSGTEMKSICSILLNAQTNFSADEYDCFRKCVKVAFDLGSVSIYRHQAIDFFISVQKFLREKATQGSCSALETEIYSLKRNINLPVNIYAPKRGGGYEHQQKQVEGLNDDQYLNIEENLLEDIEMLNESLKYFQQEQLQQEGKNLQQVIESDIIMFIL